MAENKFILTGTNNNGIRHRHSFVKNNSFKDIFRKFLGDLGFDESVTKRLFIKEDPGTGEPIEGSIYEYVDECHYYKNLKYEVDVFYGSKKIILVIRTNQKTLRDRRFKMLDSLESSSEWKEFEDPNKKKVMIEKKVRKNAEN